MDDRKQAPIALMMLPLVALGVLLAVQYFAPPKAQTEEPPAEQAPEPATEPGADAAPAQLSPTDSRSRAEAQQTYQLEDDRILTGSSRADRTLAASISTIVSASQC